MGAKLERKKKNAFEGGNNFPYQDEFMTSGNKSWRSVNKIAAFQTPLFSLNIKIAIFINLIYGGGKGKTYSVNQGFEQV